MSTDTTFDIEIPPADDVLALLATELGAELVHEGPGHRCAACSERDVRVAA